MSVSEIAWESVKSGLHRPPISRLLAFHMAYVLAAIAGHWLQLIPGGNGTLWPPSGLYLAVFLRTSRSSWPWWALAAMPAELVIDVIVFEFSLPASVGMFLGNTLEAWAGAWLVQRFGALPFRLHGLREVLALVLGAACCSPLLSTTVGATALWLSSPQPLLSLWARWWTGDAAGILIFAPLCLLAPDYLHRWREFSKPRMLEALLLLIALLASSHWVFSGTLPYTFLMLPALLWAALRFELAGAALANMLLAVIATVHTAAGQGIFGHAGTAAHQGWLLWVFLGIVSTASLLLAATTRQNRIMLQVLRAAHATLEQQVAERTAELEKSQALLRGFLDHAPAIAYVKDLEERYVLINRYCETKLGITQESVEGKTGYEVLPQDLADQFATHDRALLEREAPQQVIETLPAAEGPRTVASVRFPIRDTAGRTLLFGGIAIDVTEQQQMEASLRESEQRHRTLVEALADGVFVAQDHRFVFANAALPAMLGYAPDEFDRIPFAAVIAPEDLALWTERFDARITTEPGREPPWSYEVGLRKRSGGEPLPAELRARRINYGGRPAVLGVLRDLSARKQADAERERITALLNTLLTQAPVGFVFFDREFRYRLINDRLAEMNGLPAAAHLGRTPAEVVPALADEAHRVFSQVLATGRPVIGQEFSGETARQPGVQRHWLESWYPVRLASGEWLGVGAVIEEITQRKQAEARLRASEEFNRRVTDIAPSMLYIYDLKERRNVWGNREVTEWLGHAPADLEALTGKLLESLIHPDDWAHYPAHAQRLGDLSDGEVAEFEYRMRHADGTWRWLHSRDMIFRRDAEGLPWQIVGAALDVTERKRAEETARQAAERLSLAQQAGHVGVFDWDLKTNEAFWTPELEAIFGLPTGSFENRYAGWIQRVHPEDRPRLEALFGEWFSSGRAEAEWEYRFLRDSDERWISASGRLLRDQAGRPIRMVGTNLDITDRKRAEKTLRRYADQLEAADRRKDEFLAMLAHELRNPLAPISNAAHLLQRVHPEDAVLQNARRMIARQAAHLTRLVDDLLDATRIAQGKILLKMKTCDWAAIVRDTLEDYRTVIETAGLGVTAALPEEPVWVKGDPTRLAQMLSNLLNNAVKFTDTGGRIAVEFELDGDPHVAPASGAVLRVRDTGIGIEPDMLGRVFEVFAQADRSLDRSRGGLGLGLALVKGLVDLHGGRIEVHSAGTGQGTEFCIWLPRCGRADSKAPPS